MRLTAFHLNALEQVDSVAGRALPFDHVPDTMFPAIYELGVNGLVRSDGEALRLTAKGIRALGPRDLPNGVDPEWLDDDPSATGDEYGYAVRGDGPPEYRFGFESRESAETARARERIHTDLKIGPVVPVGRIGVTDLIDWELTLRAAGWELLNLTAHRLATDHDLVRATDNHQLRADLSQAVRDVLEAYGLNAYAVAPHP